MDAGGSSEGPNASRPVRRFDNLYDPEILRILEDTAADRYDPVRDPPSLVCGNPLEARASKDQHHHGASDANGHMADTVANAE